MKPRLQVILALDIAIDSMMDKDGNPYDDTGWSDDEMRDAYRVLSSLRDWFSNPISAAIASDRAPTIKEAADALRDDLPIPHRG